ncbi:GerMN domain-containing protein [Serpentinicella alkaliphila]|uniref:Sporulation and spore germination protein n=1 Tax=Serpentinicella alkaliphila TaxID=1734049 RepID=A0A4R2TJZ1_9FIRM|nr:GerMN domain-containing protein [Serpentinicella alkaliphila]QUH24935.1 GerMN domain-containing protein [Serpentinicella alkaliphila]TCQ02737.1 sporulation and spore germination protein [Serpentinicella alkaliphila]
MFKKLGALLLIFIIVFSLAACSTKKDNPPPNGNDVVVDPDPQESEEVEATVYYVSEEYIMTGSGEQLIPTQRVVKIGKESLEEAVIAELQKDPEEEEITTMIQDIKVISVETSNNIAYVNLSSEGLNSVGGSLQEIAIISQIVYTLTEIEGIDKVQILVDGSKRETLMGHISIDTPIGR